MRSRDSSAKQGEDVHEARQRLQFQNSRLQKCIRELREENQLIRTQVQPDLHRLVSQLTACHQQKLQLKNTIVQKELQVYELKKVNDEMLKRSRTSEINEHQKRQAQLRESMQNNIYGLSLRVQALKKCYEEESGFVTSWLEDSKSVIWQQALSMANKFKAFQSALLKQKSALQQQKLKLQKKVQSAEAEGDDQLKKQISRLNQESLVKDRRIKALEFDLGNFKKKLKDKQAALNSLQRKCSQASQRNNQLLHYRNQSQSELIQLRADAQSQSKLLAELKSSLSARVSAVSRKHQDKVGELVKSLNYLIQKTTSLESELKVRNAANRKQANDKSLISKLQRENGLLVSCLRTTFQAISEWNFEAVKLPDFEISGLEGLRYQLQKAKVRTKDQLRKAEEFERESLRSKKGWQDCQRKLNLMCKQSISQKKKIEQSLKKEVEAQRSKKKQDAAKIHQLSNSVRTLNQSNSSLSNQNEDLRLQVQRLNSHCEGLEQELSKEQDRCRNLKQQFDIGRLQKQQSLKQLKKAKTALSRAREEAEALLQNKSKLVEQLQDQLAQLQEKMGSKAHTKEAIILLDRCSQTQTHNREQGTEVEDQKLEDRNYQAELKQLYEENYSLRRQLSGLEVQIRCVQMKGEDMVKEEGKRHKEQLNALRKRVKELHKGLTAANQKVDKLEDEKRRTAKQGRPRQTRQNQTFELSLTMESRSPVSGQPCFDKASILCDLNSG